MVQLRLAAWPRRCALLGGLLLAALGAARPQAARGQTGGSFDVATTPTDGVALPPGGSQVLTAAATYPVGGFDAPVYAVAVQPDGKALLGGAFTSYRAAPAGHLARLTAAGTLDAGFATGAGPDGDVKAIVRQADGKVLVGGSFQHYNGAPARYLARLNADGSLDASFLPAGPDGPVAAIVVQPDGKILLGGDFNTYAGAARRALARALPNGALDATFQTAYASTSSPVSALALMADGRVLAGGSLSSYSATGTTTARNYIARFDPHGNLDAAFAPPQVSPNIHPIATYATAIAVQPDGKILLGGYVAYIVGTTVGFVRRLNEDGTTDFAYGNPSKPSLVTALALQADGKILVAESTFIGLGRFHDLIRLTTAGTLDAIVATGGSYQQVNSIAVQPTGQFWLGGNFTACNGHSIKYFAHLNADGTFALPLSSVAGAAYTWSTGATGPALTVAAPGVYAVTATANGQSVTSAPVFVSGGAYRLNAGGGPLATNRGPFMADGYYSPSSGSAGTGAPIAGTQDPALFQRERYSTNGTLSYALPVANGTYQVVLYFAEIYWTRPGQRVFNISLEGQPRLTNYDIVKKVGPLVATSEIFTVAVADGVLNLDMRVPYESGGMDQAKLSALEVRPAASITPPPSAYTRAPVAVAGYDQALTLPPPPAAPSTTSTTLQGSGFCDDTSDSLEGYRWSQVSGPTTATFSSLAEATPIVGNLAAGTYVFGLVVYDRYGATSDVSKITITVGPSPYTAAVRLNAGGPALGTTRGDFAADAYPDALGGRYATGALIGGTPDPALYQTERYSTNGALHFAFDVGNGDYVVLLHFAEIYWALPGQRVFDVSLEGTKVLNRYDIVQRAGRPLLAVTETFPVTVADGVLNLDLVVPYGNGGVDQAKISAVEILRGAPAPSASSRPLSSAARALPELRVYPNPSTGRCTVACPANRAQAATLTLTDPLGRVVQQRAVQLQAGDNQLAVSAPGLAPGLYQLSLATADGQRQRQKLLIQP